MPKNKKKNYNNKQPPPATSESQIVKDESKIVKVVETRPLEQTIETQSLKTENSTTESTYTDASSIAMVSDTSSSNQPLPQLQQPQQPLPQQPQQSMQQPIIVPTITGSQPQNSSQQPLVLPSRSNHNDILQEKFDCAQMVGQGVYGEVFRAVQRGSGREVAVKKIKGDPDIQYDQQGVPAQVLREVACLRDLVHENVVEFLDIHICGVSEYLLVFEYVAGGDLHKMLKNLRLEQRRMDVNLVRKFSLDLLSGVFACHSRLIIHRDLKPQNILIGQNGLKIADFGLSRAFSLPIRNNYSLDVITLWYRAPEILLGCQQYGPEVDMWSAGCILAELARGSAIFNGDSEIDTLFKIFKHVGTPSEETWPAVVNLQHWKPTFPKWRPTNLECVALKCPDLGEESLQLIRDLLVLMPNGRLSARMAKKRASQCIQHS